MYQIYKMLCRLLEEVYKEDKLLDAYKKFYIEKGNNLKSRNGCYNTRTNHIIINNLYRDNSAIMATIIHELAHHVDYCQRHTSDHSQKFYDVFFPLLRKGLDLEYYSKENLMNYKSDASDSNKIKKHLENYVPSTKPESKIIRIRVYNCFNQKDRLKELKYRFDSLSSTWTKVLSIDDLDAEVKTLTSMSVDYKVMSSDTVEFKGNVKITIRGETYDYKEELKKDGFRYDNKTKSWTKSIPDWSDYPSVVAKYRRLDVKAK